ncbi:S-adenosylmethionine-dependent methyltransferase [Ophidiomyces ophidiicola]|uniref:S-adenosylmethionine-dependent methyltransferase n=1 Tax=Ophidiomyces ophidiicola TaxID=1387563 RepID=A0ACB8V275_9EURO|nr:S-adenosylmethionine-dependent methyltransferase [Ophidiomyces ophidiicola]KAI1954545.1 S-adenosylmethionine-dependent methyltransferase [Ophidiomyces ophidiicola]KAI1961767.1 S-adenosylmethionine-dependent methyltransferase [Ophidiomyces ophidiicola]KAI1974531.1 S-adenosylmethionine-dependent methyltransferase [Ophidiomyces ophidiicola]KAI2008861.1 S-adenosylmethionine-dependent methyltransferase [Ophidiomyces ophidiicola]
MLPTPSTSHVCFDTIYEPAEDSYLLLDTLSSSTESTWLSRRFGTSQTECQTPSPPPLVAELGTGSGVVLAFAAANAEHIFGRPDILTLGIDANKNACTATEKTVHIALEEKRQQQLESPCQAFTADGGSQPQMLAAITGDLSSAVRSGVIDVLIFNPPYVPTPELPALPSVRSNTEGAVGTSKFEEDSYLLSLSYAGGEDGMETTNRLLDDIPHILSPDRGVAYILLCAQNKPHEVIQRVKSWAANWNAEIVGRSGVQAGWEKLVIVRIWREAAL